MQFSDLFHRRVSEGIDNGRCNPLIGEVFASWKKMDPEGFARQVEKAGVPLESLLAGDARSALKVLLESEHPLRAALEIAGPSLRPSPYARTIVPDIAQKLITVGLEDLVSDGQWLDVLKSTPYLIHFVHRAISLHGFVLTDILYKGWNGITERDVPEPSTLEDGRLELPFRDYMIRARFMRGPIPAHLTIHHLTLRDYTQGRYDGYTLFCPLPLAQRESLSPLGAKMKYQEYVRDASAQAFKDGFLVHNGEQYAHHAQFLLEAFAAAADDGRKMSYLVRALGKPVDLNLPPDLELRTIAIDESIIAQQLGTIVAERAPPPVGDVVEVPLDFVHGKAKVDVRPYRAILATENARRLAGVKSLGNLNHLRLAWGTQSRLEHMIGVMHFTRILCNRVGVPEKDRAKLESYALVHDWGHLSGSHSGEDYFAALMGFDHEDFAIHLIKQNAQAFEGIVAVDDLVRLFKGDDPLHTIVDGPWGADRLYYNSIDSHESGIERPFDPLDLLPWLRWNGKELVLDEMIELGQKFLDLRSSRYEQIYFAPEVQIVDAQHKQVLAFAGFAHPFEKIHLARSPPLPFVPEEGIDIDLWKCTDQLLQCYLASHPRLEVRETMRYLLSQSSRFPFATVSVLKHAGYESSEKEIEVPIHHELLMGSATPLVEGVDPCFLKTTHQRWRHSAQRQRLEHTVSERMKIPTHHLVVASVPSLERVGSEYAPVRIDGITKSLFEWNPEYSSPFVERAKRMSCLRLAVHPQWYGIAREYFETHSFAEIVTTVWGDSQIQP